MEVLIRDTRDQAVSLTAALIRARTGAEAQSRAGLATGRTMESCYELLVAMYEDDGLDFSLPGRSTRRIRGIAPGRPNSYRFYMNNTPVPPVNIDPAQIPICRTGWRKIIEASAGSYEGDDQGLQRNRSPDTGDRPDRAYRFQRAPLSHAFPNAGNIPDPRDRRTERATLHRRHPDAAPRHHDGGGHDSGMPALCAAGNRQRESRSDCQGR